MRPSLDVTFALLKNLRVPWIVLGIQGKNANTAGVCYPNSHYKKILLNDISFMILDN